MKNKILLLGGRGYVGQAFVNYFDNTGVECQVVSRSELDYYNPVKLIDAIRSSGADFLINAAGYTGKPNVDACELDKASTIQGNAVLPGIIREACEAAGITWGHVSSGCIYTGKHANGDGFSETDKPNFSFRTDNCSFYSGTKALGEEVLEGAENCYIWRLRIPFDHVDSNRNYLSKLLRYDTLLEAENSISHLEEFVSACWATMEQRVPTGIYNVTNTGSVMTSEVVKHIQKHLTPDKAFKFFPDEAEFMQRAAKTPRSNCVMDNSKLLAAGIQMTEVNEAIERSLQSWAWESR